MNIFNKPFLISMFSGLFLAFNFYMLFFYYLSPEFEWGSLSFQFKNYAGNALPFFSLGFIVSVIPALCIGWPLYLLAKSYSKVNYITSALGGVAVTITPYIIFTSLGWIIPSSTSGVIAFLVLFVCGGFAGVVFYFFEKKRIEQANPGPRPGEPGYSPNPVYGPELGN